MNLETYRSLIEQHAADKDIASVAATDAKAACDLWTYQYLQLYELLFETYYRTKRYRGAPKMSPGDPSKIPTYWAEKMTNADNQKIPFTVSEVDAIRKELLCPQRRIEVPFNPVSIGVTKDPLPPTPEPLTLDTSTQKCSSPSDCPDDQACIGILQAKVCQPIKPSCAPGETPTEKCPPCPDGISCDFQSCEKSCVDEALCNHQGYPWVAGLGCDYHPTPLTPPVIPVTEEVSCWPFAPGPYCTALKVAMWGGVAVVSGYLIWRLVSTKRGKPGAKYKRR